MTTTYTYTIYDADPNASGNTAWPSHNDLEIEAASDEEAIGDVLDVLEVEAAGLNEADGYAVGQRIYANIWDADGINLKTVSYELTAADLA
jgi:hypothetical protein